VRFDAVYHGHFKCNIRRIADYPNLSGYLRDLYATPGVAGTVDFDHIKRHYYMTHAAINPTASLSTRKCAHTFGNSWSSVSGVSAAKMSWAAWAVVVSV